MINFHKLIKKLQDINDKDLPGKQAQYLMLPPNTGKEELNNFSNYSKTKKSSVLVLLYPDKDSIKTVLILRAKYNGIHSHQISFPGGKKEIFDNSLFDTALREANEEIGIDISKVKIIGNLSKLYIQPSNFLVLPILSYTDEKPQFKANNTEVEQIIEISLSDLLNKNNIQKKEVLSSGNKIITAPCFLINNFKIWGATAMIISELLEIIKNIIYR